MRSNLERRIRRIEGMLPPVKTYGKREFSLSLGVVEFKGLILPFIEFMQLFPGTDLENVDMDRFIESWKRLIYAKKGMQVLKNLDPDEPSGFVRLLQSQFMSKKVKK